MGLLLILGVIAFVIWAVNAGKGMDKQSDVRRLNQQWIDFIASYASGVHSAKEKALVKRMLDDIERQELGRPSSATVVPAYPTHTAVQAAADQPIHQSEPAWNAQPKVNVQLDNASLLLYFGAFLFVAAAGLFVAFGNADGVVRTLIVLMVSLLLYCCGIWLYHSKPKLKQAGQAFAGMGVVLAPLVGTALYAYVFNRSQGAFVWLLTSLFCVAMYTHALLVFRTTLMSYVLIFTFLSLFESGVGLVSAPLYYYGWGLAAVSIGLQLMHLWKGWLPELREASSQAAALFLPVAVAVSIVMVPTQGATQLGVSLLLAAAFYGLEATRTKDVEQEADAVVSQSAVTLGVAALTYGATNSWFAVGVSLLTVNAAQLLLMSFYKANGKLWHSYCSVLLVVSLGAIGVALPYSELLLAAVLAALATATILWLLQRRVDAYGLAVLSWLAVPYVAGLLVFGPLSPAWQTAAGFAALLATLVVYVMQGTETRALPDWRPVAAGTYMLGAAGVLLCSAYARPAVSLGAAVALVGTFLVMLKRDRNNEWADVAGVTLFVPLLHAWVSQAYDIFLLSTLVALGTLVLLSLRFRREALRWASTFVWLLLPIALAKAQVGGVWSPAAYAWAYVLAMIGLIISRAVARGVIYLSSSVPMASYARSASLSYVVGYAAAAGLAICTSLVADGSRLHTSLVFGVLGLTVPVLSRYVEKREDLLALLPVIGQLLLLSAIRPWGGANGTYLFASLSTVTALASYFMADDAYRRAGGTRPEPLAVLQASLLSAFVTPLSVVIGVQSNWAMAVGLLVASALLQYHIRAHKQGDKELAGGLMVLGIWWLLYFAGVRQLQAYTHVAVATFGLYAYWRYMHGEREQSDQYIWWALGTATAPLALQALSGAGSLYGWWFLLEQITIMLVGMAVERRFVVRWGLYASVAAVLWQLRGLGYAALGFLALFLIALAVYKLQKYNDQK